MTRLGKFLVQEGILSTSDQQMIRRESVQNHGSFARSILALGLLDEDELSALFASKTNFRQASKHILNEMSYDCRDLAPLHIIAWLEVLPLVVKDGTLTVATVDPTDPDVVNQLEFFTGLRIKPVIATRSQILSGLKELGATLDVGESRFEAFLKTHSRMSETAHKKRAGAKKKFIEEDEGPDDMDFNFDGMEGDTAEQTSNAKDNLEFNAGADLANPELAAIATDDLVDEANMGMAVDMPAELADDSSDFHEEALGEASGAGVSIEAELPDFAADLGDEDPFAGLGDDDEKEAGLSAASAPNEGISLDDIGADNSSDELSAAENLDAFSASEESSAEEFNVDLNADLGTGKPLDASMLPGGLEDDVMMPSEIEEKSESQAFDVAEMDAAGDDFNLEESNELSLSSEDLVATDDPDLTASEAQGDLVLEDEVLSPGEEISTKAGESLEFNEILHDSPDHIDSNVGMDSVEISESIPDIGGFEGLEESTSNDESSFSEPNILEESFASSAAEPTFDVSFDGESANSASAVESVQSHEPEITKTASGNLVGAPHLGVAVFTRALVQLQMTSEPQKVLSKMAETAGKAGINGGAIFKFSSGAVKTGVTWHKEGGKFGSIPQVPAGIDQSIMLALSTNESLQDGWNSIIDCLGDEGAKLIAAWPQPESAPNFVLLRKQGDDVTFALAEFKGASDHEGLKQSFADVIRAVSQKI